MSETNDQLALICGMSSTGKSASLQNIREQENWAYLNSEAGKRLPFKNSFNTFRIEDPYQVFEAFDVFTGKPENKGIIIDSITFLMDMLESLYVIGSANTQSAWGSYQQFFKTLMQTKVVRYGKPVLMTAHTLSVYNEATLSNEVAVPIKGALKNNGIEAYFSTIVAAKKVPLKELENYKNNLLNITEEDEILGYKHVFQTRLTKATVGERIRSPMGMFTREQTYMDNDAQLLLDHLNAFYGV
jgi:hypothetical protein